MSAISNVMLLVEQRQKLLSLGKQSTLAEITVDWRKRSCKTRASKTPRVRAIAIRLVAELAT